MSFAVLTVVACGFAYAQSLYKFRGVSGEWIYSDRPPDDGLDAEMRELDRVVRPRVTVTHEMIGDEIEFTAHNQFHAPMEVALVFDVISGIAFPESDDSLRWVVPPNSDLTLLGLALPGSAAAPNVNDHYIYLPGDPESEHQPSGGYRVPFSAGSD